MAYGSGFHVHVKATVNKIIQVLTNFFSKNSLDRFKE